MMRIGMIISAYPLLWPDSTMKSVIAITAVVTIERCLLRFPKRPCLFEYSGGRGAGENW